MVNESKVRLTSEELIKNEGFLKQLTKSSVERMVIIQAEASL
ncbi:hypothetical protein LBBP_00565 [Leptospira borgpetersenii serovar Ballum]|uniref:Uncharacterized protein n=1 Tax=Leptospira borgpetersenii serovar Ballum TaxID=280505 RepID=A0A0S2IML5_LEPBO|nr:hypothetical protein LBBP_00565 [Leptospira borgpetersenii serovar Ballum]